MARFGIITPTFRRERFLPRVIRQIRKQTYPHWSSVLISDGPSPRTQRLFTQHHANDARMHYLETAHRANDFGGTPRSHGLKRLITLPERPDYVVFWDDDNEFYPHALDAAATELERHNHPDLLLLPLHYQSAHTPRAGVRIQDVRSGDIDGASFVIRTELAETLFDSGVLPSGYRGDDYRLFDYVRSDNRRRIPFASAPPIGRYDGLRFFACLRWKLRIPPFHISEQVWYKPMRVWLRG